MKQNDRIYVKKFLDDLNGNTKTAIAFHHVKKDYVRFLTCASLAAAVEVTPTTITNLTTSSKFYLLHRVAEEILDAYYGYFSYLESWERRENPDEIIYPKDVNYVLMQLTSYYTDEFLSY